MLFGARELDLVNEIDDVTDAQIAQGARGRANTREEPLPQAVLLLELGDEVHEIDRLEV